MAHSIQFDQKFLASLKASYKTTSFTCLSQKWYSDYNCNSYMITIPDSYEFMKLISSMTAFAFYNERDKWFIHMTISITHKIILFHNTISNARDNKIP